MNANLRFDGYELWNLAGWTMLHFLWLGALVAAAAALCRLLARRAAPNVRYAIALASLFLLAALPTAIAAWLISISPPFQGGARGGFATADLQLAEPLEITSVAESIIELVDPMRATGSASASLPHENVADALSGPPPSGLAPPPLGADGATQMSSPGATGSVSASSTPPMNMANFAWIRQLAAMESMVAYLPWLWLVGTPITFALLATGVLGTRRLRKASRTLDNGPIVELAAKLAASMRLARLVTIAVCDRVAAPVLIGIVRPMILLPPAALTGWSPDEIEMVLLHELAHVRRWDNLVNLLQRLIESLLFFHPAVWLVSNWVRREREACCDAVVVDRTNRPHAYAEMLVALAAQMPRNVLFHPAASSAMAAGPLRARIRRILSLEDDPMLISGKSFVVVLAALVVAATLAVLYVPTIGQAEESAAAAEEAAAGAEESTTGGSEEVELAPKPLEISETTSGLDDDEISSSSPDPMIEALSHEIADLQRMKSDLESSMIQIQTDFEVMKSRLDDAKAREGREGTQQSKSQVETLTKEFQTQFNSLRMQLAAIDRAIDEKTKQLEQKVSRASTFTSTEPTQQLDESEDTTGPLIDERVIDTFPSNVINTEPHRLFKAIDEARAKNHYVDILTEDQNIKLVAVSPPTEADWRAILGNPPRKDRVIAEKAWQRLGLKLVPANRLELWDFQMRRVGGAIRILGGNVPDGLPLPAYLRGVEAVTLESFDNLHGWLDDKARHTTNEPVRVYAWADGDEYLFDAQRPEGEAVTGTLQPPSNLPDTELNLLLQEVGQLQRKKTAIESEVRRVEGLAATAKSKLSEQAAERYLSEMNSNITKLRQHLATVDKELDDTIKELAQKTPIDATIVQRPASDSQQSTPRDIPGSQGGKTPQDTSRNRFPSLEDLKLADLAWERLGLELQPIDEDELKRVRALDYEGGLKVIGGQGEMMSQDIQLVRGDILVGLHAWPTTTFKEVAEIIQRDDLEELNPLRFYVVRRVAGGGGFGGGRGGYGEGGAYGRGGGEARDELVIGRIRVRSEKQTYPTPSLPPTAPQPGRPGRTTEPMSAAGGRVEQQMLGDPQAAHKSRLRYEGKTFDQWRAAWRTELSTEKRSDAINALAAFGAHGYGKEAAETILEVVKQYEWNVVSNTPSGKLKKDAIAAFAGRGDDTHAIPWQEWLPVLTDAVRAGDERAAAFAEHVIAQLHIDNEEVLANLLELSRDTSLKSIRTATLQRLGNAFTSNQDPRIEERMVEALREDAAAAKIALNALYSNRQAGVFGGGGYMGGGYGRSGYGGYGRGAMGRGFGAAPQAQPKLEYRPEILDVLQSDDADARQIASYYLSQIGPDAKPAVPRLFDLLFELETDSATYLATVTIPIITGSYDAVSEYLNKVIEEAKTPERVKRAQELLRAVEQFRDQQQTQEHEGGYGARGAEEREKRERQERGSRSGEIVE